MGSLYTDKQTGRLHGAQLDQGDRLANHNSSSLRLHILMGDGKAMVAIFCILYQYSLVDNKGRLCHFPLSLTLGWGKGRCLSFSHGS